MSKFIFVVFVILFLFLCLVLPFNGRAAPFLVCDPQTGVTHYKLTGPAWVTSPVTAQTDGSLRMDVSAATVGLNSITVAACRTGAEGYEVCSTSLPFTFTKPVSPVSPANIKLSQ